MKVPFYGHVKQYQNIKAEIDANIQRVLMSGEYVQGPMLKQFEAEFAKYSGTKFAVGVGNGTGRPVVAQVGANPDSVATMVTTNYAAFGNFPSGKPATTCTGAIGTYGANGVNANDTVDNNQVSLTLGGLYPYAGCEFEIDIHNDGGIPFHIALTSVSLQSCTDNTYTTCVPAATAPWSIGLAPGSPAACTAFLGAIATATVNTQINTGPNAPVQIHDGQDLVCRFKLILNQANVENAFYKFSAVYRAFQWNEAPYGP